MTEERLMLPLAKPCCLCILKAGIEVGAGESPAIPYYYDGLHILNQVLIVL